MELFDPVLRSTALFCGIPDEALPGLLDCFCALRRRYGKGETILQAGQPNTRIGILLEGNIRAMHTAPDGSLCEVTRMGPGGMFGDVLCGSGIPSPVTVQAAQDCTVLFLDYERILSVCSRCCAGHSRVLQNLVRTVSGKYFALNRRVDLLTIKGLRARVCAWLLGERDRQGSDTFADTRTRAELAAYLNCERSALSRELGRLQAEGLIETYRGSFKLLNPAALAQLAI